MSSTALNAARRAEELALLTSEVIDLVVIGGGITGVGVALDATTRGLTVALLERHDLASGTSSWSSKLVHGGLRYLATGAVGVAMESARERRILMERTAPHLAHPLAFVIPINDSASRRQVLEARVGGRLGDVLRVAARTKRTTLPPARRISAATVRKLIPGIESATLSGGLLSWDGQLEDDARLVVSIARSAAGAGARIITRAEVVGLSRTSAGLHALEVTDTITGESHTVKARHVINATGVWASTLTPQVKLRPSKGAHISVDASLLGSPTAALTVPVPGQRARYVFALPQPDGTCLVGLTDDEYEGPLPDEPQVSEADISFLLDVVNTALSRRLSPANIIGRFAGLRPLLDAEDGSTADISRKHAVIEDDSGVVTIVGGKLTTYRKMAEDVVDLIVRRPGVQAGRCRTRDLGVVGSAAVSSELRRSQPRLVRRYGSEAAVVLAMAEQDPSLLEPVAVGSATLAVEFAYGIAYEGALTAADLLDRRTRLDYVQAWRDEALPLAEAMIATAVEQTG